MIRLDYHSGLLPNKGIFLWGLLQPMLLHWYHSSQATQVLLFLWQVVKIGAIIPFIPACMAFPNMILWPFHHDGLYFSSLKMWAGPMTCFGQINRRQCFVPSEQSLTRLCIFQFETYAIWICYVKKFELAFLVMRDHMERKVQLMTAPTPNLFTRLY